jgi:hypothetical protein
MKSYKEILQRPIKKHENPARKSYAQNVQHKARSNIRVRQEKEAEFIHSQRKKKRRRKNPDQNTVTGKEDKLKLHAQPTSCTTNLIKEISQRLKSMYYHKHGCFQNYLIGTHP